MLLEAQSGQNKSSTVPKHDIFKTDEMLKTLYASCMNEYVIEELGITPLHEELALVGGWPVVVGDKWPMAENSSTPFIWYDQEVNSLFASGIFDVCNIICFDVVQDPKDPDRNFFRLDAPNWGPWRSEFAKGVNNPYVKLRYSTMVKAAVLFGADQNRALTDMSDVLQFIIKMARLTYNRKKARNLASIYNIYCAAEGDFKELYPEDPSPDMYLKVADLDVNLLAIFHHITQPNTTFHPDPQRHVPCIWVANPNYVKNIWAVLGNTSLRTISNYMGWRRILSKLNYMNNAARSLMEYEHFQIFGIFRSY